MTNNNMDYYDIFDLKGCVYGAPNIMIDTFKKIIDVSYILEENNQSESYLNVVNEQTSGIRLRFKTNSKKIALSFEIGRKGAYERVMVSASSGFDVYCIKKGQYNHLTVIAPDEQFSYYEEVIELPDNDCVEIYFPLYNSVKRLSIGIVSGCKIEPSTYELDGSIIFYGNSCTQGAGASRSGNAYPNIVSRMLSADIINYAFNTTCRGEKSVARELSTKNAIAFVIDYQFNSDIGEFKERFEDFYLCIREQNEKVPIILIDTLFNSPYNQHIQYVYQKCHEHDPFLFCIELSKLFCNYDRNIISVDGIHYPDICGPAIAEKISNIVKPFLKY